MSKHFFAMLIVLVALFGTVPSYASTQISTYGRVTLVTYNYGTGGLVNNIQITMLNLDMSGEFVYYCRRPNLGPCANVVPGLEYHFQANLTSTCLVPNKICGEGTISSITPLSSF